MLQNVTLLLCSLAACGLAAELITRALFPTPVMKVGDELGWLQLSGAEARKTLVVDPELGFRPIVGQGLYDQYGTLRSSYVLAKPPEKTRILFIGDSVTARGAIVAALRQRYGDERFEYWNAGVESFNTRQELVYFKKFNRQIAPDIVVLTFHFNDLGATPIAFFDEHDVFRVYSPYRPVGAVLPWLFARSRLYQVFVARRAGTEPDPEAIAAETKASLAELQQLVRQDGARLIVLLHPVLKEENAFEPRERAQYADAQRIFGELRLPYFDLTPIVQRAIRDGIQVKAEPDDSWHPSAQLADIVADDLERQDIFPPPPSLIASPPEG